MFRRRDRIEVKTAEQLQVMRRAGLVVAATLQALTEAAAPGVTTAELDQLARDQLAAAGATSSFLHYGQPPFPGVICASVNDEVVHGIPGDRVLRDGDLLSVDFGAIVDGWHGDAAVSIAVGTLSDEVARLSHVTEESLWAGLAQALAGGRLSDVGHAVEATVRRLEPAPGAYGILSDYVGHGIGSAMHMDPAVPNYGAPGRGPTLLPGMALAVEPMVVAGPKDVYVDDDDWTVRTDQGAVAAHWEHTVAITEDGPWVLTALDGGAARFAALGVPSPAAHAD
ncbi:MAG: type I methionyl aminopeptidase [Actinomycetota bacterium]|nr:MAG: type I methionyl aminopeptidase [Actinomycetota bacterium]